MCETEPRALFCAVAVLDAASATHHTHTAPDGTTVLLGQKAVAAAQRDADACAGGLAALCCGR